MGKCYNTFGTFNCLRVKSILTKIDTTYIDFISLGTTIPRPQEIEYKWLAAAEGVPVLKIITVGGNVTQISYKDSIRLNVSVAELSKFNNVTIFPNPATTHLIVDYTTEKSGILKLSLIDILGNHVANIYDGNQSLGQHKLAIDLTPYSIKAGIYFVQFMVDGKKSYSQKVIIGE